MVQTFFFPFIKVITCCCFPSVLQPVRSQQCQPTGPVTVWREAAAGDAQSSGLHTCTRPKLPQSLNAALIILSYVFVSQLLESIAHLQKERDRYAEQIQEEGRVWKDKTEQLLTQVDYTAASVRSLVLTSFFLTCFACCIWTGVFGGRRKGPKHQKSSRTGGWRHRAEKCCR